jgi:hypothetical protein
MARAQLSGRYAASGTDLRNLLVMIRVCSTVT